MYTYLACVKFQLFPYSKFCLTRNSKSPCLIGISTCFDCQLVSINNVIIHFKHFVRFHYAISTFFYELKCYYKLFGSNWDGSFYPLQRNQILAWGLFLRIIVCKSTQSADTFIYGYSELLNSIGQLPHKQAYILELKSMCRILGHQRLHGLYQKDKLLLIFNPNHNGFKYI